MAIKVSKPEQLELFSTTPGVGKMTEIIFNEKISQTVKSFVIKAWSFWPSLLQIFIRCGLGKTEEDVLLSLNKMDKGFSGKVSSSDIKGISPEGFSRLARMAQEKEPADVSAQTLYGIQSHKALQDLTKQGYVNEEDLSVLRSVWKDCCSLYQTPQVWAKNFIQAERVLSRLQRELQRQVSGELPFLPTKGQPERLYLSGLTWLAWASFFLNAPKRMVELNHFFEVPCLPDNYLGRRRIDHAAVVNFDQKNCPEKFHMGHLLHFGKKTVISEWKLWLNKNIPFNPAAEHVRSVEDYLLRSIMALAMVKNGRFSFQGVDWSEFRGLIKYIRSFDEPISYQISLPFPKAEKILMELASHFNKVQERARLRQLANKALLLIEGKNSQNQLELEIVAPSQLFVGMYGHKKT